MKSGTAKPTKHWTFGNIFSKNTAATDTTNTTTTTTNTTSKAKEDPRQNSKTDAIQTVHWTAKIKGLNATEKAKVLETELKAMEEQLKTKTNTIKYLQDLHAGVGLKASVAGFQDIKDKDCRQLIQDTQTLYRELEEFNQTVNHEDKSKYEPPVAPVAKLVTMTKASRNHQHLNGSTSNRPGGVGEINSKLANIRLNWEEHNFKIIDLNDRLKAAYDYIRELKSTTPTADPEVVEAPISGTKVMKNYRAPSPKEKNEPTSWYDSNEKGVDKKQKNVLLSLVGGDASESEEEGDDDDVYKAHPAKSYYQPPEVETNSGSTMMQAKVYAEIYDGGKKPDWLDESGEINITPVKATFINSLHNKAERMKETEGHIPPQEGAAVPNMYSNVPPPKNRTEFYRGSIDKLGKSKSNESDITDDDESKDKSRHAATSYKFYTQSTMQNRPNISSSYQSQMKKDTNATSYRQEPAVINYRSDSHPRTQEWLRTENVRQASNEYGSDVD